MKICPSCKAENPNNAKYCNQCGLSLTETKEEALEKAWRFYNENKEAVDLLAREKYPFVREFKALALKYEKKKGGPISPDPSDKP